MSDNDKRNIDLNPNSLANGYNSFNWKEQDEPILTRIGKPLSNNAHPQPNMFQSSSQAQIANIMGLLNPSTSRTNAISSVYQNPMASLNNPSSITLGTYAPRASSNTLKPVASLLDHDKPLDDDDHFEEAHDAEAFFNYDVSIYTSIYCIELLLYYYRIT
jgi:hypothetical protein